MIVLIFICCETFCCLVILKKIEKETGLYFGRGAMKTELKKIVSRITCVIGGKVRSFVKITSRILFLCLKFASIIFLVFFVPKLISVWSNVYQNMPAHQVRVLSGAENIVYNKNRYKGLKRYRFGLIHNNNNNNNFSKFLSEHEFRIKKVFALDDFYHKKLEVSFKKHIKKLDAFFVDVQDSGIYSEKMFVFLKDLLNFSSRHRKKVVVLDRPNPLGRYIEGPGAIPWRHGLTIGELTLYINKEFVKNTVDLTVVPVVHWKRTDYSQKSILSKQQNPLGSFLGPINFIKPITVKQASFGHGHTILLRKEDKLSKWEVRYLKRLCWHLGLHCVGCFYRDEKRGHLLHGVKLALKNNVNNFSAFNTVLTVSRFLKNRKQIKLLFKKDFDNALGSKLPRKFLEGRISFKTMKKQVEKSLQTFYDKSIHCCLYRPLPVVVMPEIIKV